MSSPDTGGSMMTRESFKRFSPDTDKATVLRTPTILLICLLISLPMSLLISLLISLLMSLLMRLLVSLLISLTMRLLMSLLVSLLINLHTSLPISLGKINTLSTQPSQNTSMSLVVTANSISILLVLDNSSPPPTHLQSIPLLTITDQMEDTTITKITDGQLEEVRGGRGTTTVGSPTLTTAEPGRLTLTDGEALK